MGSWTAQFEHDPLPWLLEDDTPPVRHLALRDLLDRTDGDAELEAAKTAAMSADPIASILAAQDAEGWWVARGSGYLPKYTATTWQVSFLDQMGADGRDPRVRAACEYVLQHAQTSSGGFGIALRSERVPTPGNAIHCLNGNLLRALLGFGWAGDERVMRSAQWHAAIINGDPSVRHYQYVPKPGFACAATDGEPCAWGAIKAVTALARVPAERRTPEIDRAIDAGVEFLLSRDPSTAAYPTAKRDPKPSSSWFKLGFPSGYVCDVLGVLEAVAAAGRAGDPRIGNAVTWLLTQQGDDGRWVNRYTYGGKMIVDVDEKGVPSKWVTLRACRVLRAVAAAN